jgi:hypothetical protein
MFWLHRMLRAGGLDRRGRYHKCPEFPAVDIHRQ